MARETDSGDDRPRKTWRERDKGRDKSRHVSTSSDRERERFEKTTAYTRYKQNLEKVFSGGELSDAMRERLDPTGQGKARDALLRKVREAEDNPTFHAALEEFLAREDFPDDLYLLDRALDHPNGTVVGKALDRLEALSGEGKLAKPPKSLKQRLASIELTADDPALQERAHNLKSRLP
jgi:hypothetical protein